MYALKFLDHGDLIRAYKTLEEARVGLERLRELEPERAEFAAIVEIRDGHVIGVPLALHPHAVA